MAECRRACLGMGVLLLAACTGESGKPGEEGTGLSADSPTRDSGAPGASGAGQAAPMPRPGDGGGDGGGNASVPADGDASVPAVGNASVPADDDASVPDGEGSSPADDDGNAPGGDDASVAEARDAGVGAATDAGMQGVGDGGGAGNGNGDGDDSSGDGTLPVNATPPMVASTLGSALGALDPYDLPATLSEADAIAHVPLMRSFETALGTNCAGCHRANRAADTPNKRIARHMWDDMLGKLEMVDGSPFYCDSCHQGQMRFLDRSNTTSLSIWMQENFVNKLRRRDGQPHDCSTCHGQPPDYDLVTTWSQ